MRERQEDEQRQVGEQEDRVPQAVQQRRVEPLPVEAVRRERDQLARHDAHGQQEDGAEARGQRERAQPDAHAVGEGVLVVEHVLVGLLGLAQQADGEVGERVQKAVDEDAHDDLAYVVVELLLLVVDALHCLDVAGVQVIVTIDMAVVSEIVVVLVVVDTGRGARR